MRFFNTAGPVDCDRHYCLPPLSRLDLHDILTFIAQQKYFVLHAPRQVGKTSYLLALMDYLNREGAYHCLYFNVEIAQAARENVNEGMRAILSEMGSSARNIFHDPFVASIWPDILARSGGFAALSEVLTRWAEQCPRPLVLLIDEIDALIGDTLIAVLRQLRAGYAKRPGSFPQSIILCGVRDVRDYRIHSSQRKAIITGGSAFNVKAESLRLDDFSQREVETLFLQHTTETGQRFESSAVGLVWELAHGQPWLTNALGYEVCFRMKAGRDRAKPITAGMMIEAKERIILRRETHIDQLVDKLGEERVRKVIEPLLAGQSSPDLIPTDDIQYVCDLGLTRIERGQLAIANRIYQEVIPRELTYSTQLTISHQPAWYIAPDGRLEMDKLLSAFQVFYRQHSEHWIERFEYKEAGPQLLSQAFLHRLVNAGSRVEREYGLGRLRTDLLVIWPYDDAVQRVVLELKVRHGSLERTIEQGLAQTWAYMDRYGADEGHLVVFDRDPAESWDEKVFTRRERYRGVEVVVWGM